MTQTKVEAPFVENNRPFRNIIINGDMQVAQRATSTTGVANDSDEGYNSLDRFGLYYYGNEGGAATMSQDTTVPSDTSYGVQRQSLKIDVTTADTSLGSTGIIALKHTVEAQYIHHSGWDFTSSSSKITLSFWARSVKAGTYCVLFRCHDASGERYFVKEYTLVADTWKHVEMVVPGDSNLVFNADNGEGLEMRWILAAGDDRNDATADTWFAPGSDYDNSTSNQVNFYDSTSNNFFLTGVQLEVGDQATDFEHLPYDVQLRRCMRYFVSYSTNVGDQPLIPEGDSYISNGFMYTSSNMISVIHLPVPMNHRPDLTTTNSTGTFQFYRNGAGDALDDLTLSTSSSNIACGIYNSSDASGTAGHAGGLYLHAGTMTFDSEL